MMKPTRSTTAGLAIAGTFLLCAANPGNTASPVPKLLNGIAKASSSIRVGGGAPRHPSASAARPVLPISLGAGHPQVLSVAPSALRVPVEPVVPAPLQGPRCDDSQARGGHPKYDGLSVSALYDQVFHAGLAVPYLDTYVPQALSTWTDWDTHGHTLILLGMYREHHKSYLVGINPDTGAAIATVMIAPTHLGGMGIIGDWLFAQDDNPVPHHKSHPTVRRYRVEALRAAMQQAAHTGQKTYLDTDGTPEPIDAIDFFAVEGNSVYAGNHGAPHGRMYRYQLTPTGHLHPVEGPWSIPPRAQGMILTPEDFLFSGDEGLGRGRLSVVRRATPDQTKAPIACLWIPAMPEDLTVYNGNLISVFESGTTRYANDHPVNRITQLHVGSLAALLELTDPVILASGVSVDPS
jgi:hypothetical protein